MLHENLEIRENLMNSFYNDPFDLERDFIVRIFINYIPYLRKMDEGFLKQLYYKSNEHYFELNE
jgi:hypothetical protein